MNRRAVLRCSAKLLYATPVIVTTVKMTEQHAMACSPPLVCGPCEYCNDATGCEPIPGCTVPN